MQAPSSFDKLILKLSYLLGANYFKKYWPVGGSAWKTVHLDKTSIFELENVIDNARSYSATHVQGLATEAIIYIPITFMALYHKSQQALYSLTLLPFLWFIHLYALMIHHHNRIRARLAIDQLQKDPKQIEKVKAEQLEQQQVITIKTSDHKNVSYFYLCFDYARISPAFATYQQAKAYRQYLYSLWSEDYFKISESIFINNKVEIYKQYKKQL